MLYRYLVVSLVNALQMPIDETWDTYRDGVFGAMLLVIIAAPVDTIARVFAYSASKICQHSMLVDTNSVPISCCRFSMRVRLNVYTNNYTIEHIIIDRLNCWSMMWSFTKIYRSFAISNIKATRIELINSIVDMCNMEKDSKWQFKLH